jgi:hypothetical protein
MEDSCVIGNDRRDRHGNSQVNAVYRNDCAQDADSAGYSWCAKITQLPTNSAHPFGSVCSARPAARAKVVKPRIFRPFHGIGPRFASLSATEK